MYKTYRTTRRTQDTSPSSEDDRTSNERPVRALPGKPNQDESSPAQELAEAYLKLARAMSSLWAQNGQLIQLPLSTHSGGGSGV